MRALITGGAGNLARQRTDELLGEGHRVVLVDLLVVVLARGAVVLVVLARVAGAPADQLEAGVGARVDGGGGLAGGVAGWLAGWLAGFQTFNLSNFQSLKVFSNFQTFKLSNFPL